MARVVAPAPVEDRAAGRLWSLDAYRGLVMVLLAGSGFGIAQTAQNFPDSAAWQSAGYQFEHVAWRGCTLWDMIQPSFMFMVGVAVPYSFAAREARGTTGWRLYALAAVRAVVLILLGIALRSNGRDYTNFTFEDVLTQIGLGYFFLALLWQRRLAIQLLAIGVLLGGYYAWFALSPAVSPETDLSSVGVPADWPRLKGFEAHWEKNANPAHRFDVWFLNLFPRPEPFAFNGGGYQTTSFIPSLVTMILGLMAGECIRRNENRRRAFLLLLGAGVLLAVAGWGLDAAGLCPLVKRIWTPSWTLFSDGLTLMALAVFYGVIDGLGWKAWSYPLVIAGWNSIALYIMENTLHDWTSATLVKHFGSGLYTVFGTPYAPIVESVLVLAVFWLFVYWLARQKIFFRI